jgi:predicted  nucleic acid-binding Zn-ribbon protein
MESVDGMLKSLEIKVQQFAELYVKLKEERDQLINQSVNLKETIEEKDKEIENLKNQVRDLEMARQENAENEQELSGAKDRIKDLVREIDRCIELLNK